MDFGGSLWTLVARHVTSSSTTTSHPAVPAFTEEEVGGEEVAGPVLVWNVEGGELTCLPQGNLSCLPVPSTGSGRDTPTPAPNYTGGKVGREGKTTHVYFLGA